MDVEIPAFGEGFWVTVLFMLMVSMILCVAMYTGNAVAKDAATSAVLILGMIAAFWFPTRGQTTAQLP